MAIIRKTKMEDYVVIHHVYGEHDVIDFLRMTSKTVVNRLFFDAKCQGSAEFNYREKPYRITWTKTDLFEIDEIEESVRDVF